MISPAKGRLASIDFARFLAAFGIVWAHAGAPGAEVGYLALATFLLMTAYLAVLSWERSGAGASLFSRARRIVVPWLFWSLFYLAVHLAMRARHGGAGEPLLSNPFALLIGPSIHLWFLPFLMMASLFIPPLEMKVRSRASVWLVCGALVALSLPLLWLHGFARLPEPFPQWAFALPHFLFGAVLALARRQGMLLPPLLAALVISGVSVAVTGAFWSVQMLLSWVLFEALWRMELNLDLMRKLGRQAFGIYLLHPFFALFVYKALGADVHWLPLTLLCFGLSWAATALLLRLPGLRGLV